MQDFLFSHKRTYLLLRRSGIFLVVVGTVAVVFKIKHSRRRGERPCCPEKKAAELKLLSSLLL